MEFTYENQGASTYLVYEIKPTDSVDTLSLGMLTNNNISGIARTLFTQIDESRFIKYNVSSKISMQQYFSGIVNRKRLLGVFGSIVEGLAAAEDYMLDLSSIILEPDYIFVDVSNCSALLICVPIGNVNNNKNDLCAFFKNVMVNTKFDQTENSDHVAKIFNYLNSCVELSLADFKQLIDELKNEQIGISVQQITPSASAVQPLNQPPVQPPMSQMNNNRQATQYNPVMQQPPAQNIAASHPNNYQPRPGQISRDNPKQNSPVSPMPQNTMPARPVTSVQGMAVPPQQMPQMNQTPPANGQKKMSMFDLLRHYSKENKEIYRQQKAAQKAQNLSAKQNISQPGAPAQAGFAVPGANPNMPGPSVNSNKNNRNPGFAVPGMQNNVTNASFAQGNGSVSFNTPGNPASNPAPSPAGQALYPAGKPNGANFNVPGSAPNVPASNQPPRNIPPMSAPSPVPVQAPSSAPAPTPVPAPQPAPQPVMSQGQHLNFGETTVLSGKKPGETTVLNGGAQPRQTMVPHLIRAKNGEKIYINKPFFRIGKEKSYVDYFIGDNTAVSRSHANIVTNNDKFFIVDTNSTNHTFVNGSMIQSNIETPINHGDKIRLGNEEFEFRLY